MAEQHRKPPDDREPEAHPPPAVVVTRRPGELHELVEHPRAIGVGDAHARVDDVDAHDVAAPARTEHDAAGARVADARS